MSCKCACSSRKIAYVLENVTPQNRALQSILLKFARQCHHMPFKVWTPYILSFLKISDYSRPMQFSSCGVFFLLLSFFFSSPNLSSHRLDVYHISTHDDIYFLVAFARQNFAGANFNLRPSLAFSYIGSVTARHSSSGRQPQTLRHDARNGIAELSQRAPLIFCWAAITLGTGPHSSLCYGCVWRTYAVTLLAFCIYYALLVVLLIGLSTFNVSIPAREACTAKDQGPKGWKKWGSCGGECSPPTS